MGIRRRLDALEGRFKNKEPAPVVYSGLALEIREIDEEIKKLTAEIAEAEAGMTPAELTRSRAELEEFDKSLVGLELDQKIEALKAEIALLEAGGEGVLS